MTRTALTCLRGGVLLLLTTSAALSLPATPSKRAEVFAICAGRMAALATHREAIRAQNSGDIRAAAQDFDMMLDATLPAALDRGVPPNLPRQWRAQGWVEIAGHLADSTYSFDAGRARRATEWLERKVASCRDLLLH